MNEHIEAVWGTVQTAPRYPYPWTDLLKDVTVSLPLVGYGSLINRVSAQRTINAGSRRVPVFSYGGKLFFDYVMPLSTQQRYGEAITASKAYGVLNVHPTGQLTDWFNGVLIDVPGADLP